MVAGATRGSQAKEKAKATGRSDAKHIRTPQLWKRQAPVEESASEFEAEKVHDARGSPLTSPIFI